MIRLFRKADLVSLLFLLLLTGCGVGDDDGQRLGDYIVGTWQRGWNPGDVVIEGAPLDEEGNPLWTPENFTYDKFIFNGDGGYNGMVRSGSFCALNVDGDTIYVGDYRCDNSNLKLNYKNEGKQQSILAQIRSFSENLMVIGYQNEELQVTVMLTLRKE